jgi:ligand-binding sensor domain-containing protein
MTSKRKKLTHLSKLFYLRAILLLVFICFVVQGYSQFDPVYKRFTVNDGLAGNETYHIFQDSKGYIWIATNNGVSLFDGYNFKNFDVQTGLVDNIVFEIYEDYKGRIWFVPFSCELCYYENGKIHVYPFNYKIRQHMPTKSRGPLKLSFYVDTLDNVYLGVKNYGIMHINPEGIFKKLNVDEDTKIIFNEISSNKILITTNEKTNSKDLLIHSNKQNVKISLENIIKINTPIYTYAIKDTDSTIYASFEGTLVYFENNRPKWIDKSTSNIIWLSKDDEYLFVSDFNGGIKFSPISNKKSFQPRTILKNFQITSVIKDTEGAYWLSTLNNGIIYIPDIHIQTITKENGISDIRVKAVYEKGENIYLGYQMGWVDVIRNGKISKINLLKNSGNASFVRSFLGDEKNDKLWICSFGHLGYLQDDKFHVIKNNNTIYPRKIIKSRIGNYYWVATATGIIKIENDKVVYDSRNDGFSAMALAIEEDDQGDIWFLTYNGLWKYSNKLYQFMGNNDPLLAYTGSSLLYNPDNQTLWIGTNGAGVVILNKHGQTSQISKNEGLISNSITQIKYRNGKYWVGTRQGLSVITSENGDYKIQNITTYDGIVSNDISALYISDSLAYIGTSEGLSIIDINKFSPNTTLPRVYITSIETSDSTRNFVPDTLHLKYDTKYALISFNGIAYKNMGRIPYRYRLLGLDSNWVYTSSTQCLYSVLKPGKLKFEVQAQNSNGIWGPTSSMLIFVSSPIWQKIWFIALFAIIFSLLLYLVYHYRMSELKKRNALLNNINLYKQQSLRQQMNPHFIFNTLNSIQYYILEKDTISSHKYLTKFARLMRFTLDNSLHSVIPLRDELYTLKLYLELEALRLQGKFTYTIDYDNNESILEVKIPTLMIQPFVENAIWHGIMLKPDKSGHVQVTISDMETSVLCTIEDNGVGREQARKIQETTNKAHRSRGFQITQQRIDLLNSMYGQKFNIQIVDLYSHDGTPQGTRVTINIPKGLESS